MVSALQIQNEVNSHFNDYGSVFYDGNGISNIMNATNILVDDLPSYFSCFDNIDLSQFINVQVHSKLNTYQEQMILMVDLLSDKSGVVVNMPLTSKEQDRLWNIYVERTLN